MITHKIQKIAEESIAQELGVEPGDFLLSIDGAEIKDVLDYRFMMQSDFLTVEIEKADGEIWELEIEKEPEDDLGLEFEQPLMSEARVCCNKCVFCFVDQQPPGLRDTLYVKDDDARLSFLMGNYATLTNVSYEEVRRLAWYHLSPLRISVHAADMDLRCKMMGSQRAAWLFDALEAFNAAGIEMHFQAVVCKGLNDGAALDYTIERLGQVTPSGASLAIVPVGLTGNRDGCFPLEAFSPADSAQVIRQVEGWQDKFREVRGSSFVFLADEWYVLAGLPLPALDIYEDFPQLDNGVGVVRLFEEEFLAGLEEDSVGRNLRPTDVETDIEASHAVSRNCHPPGAIGVVTGVAAAKFIRGLAGRFMEVNPGVEVRVFSIENHFFGENVTVSGLLVGQDVIAQLAGKLDGVGVIFLPQNAFRANTEDMLDGTTRQQLEEALNVSVEIGSSDGEELYWQLKGWI
ncbi:MAG: DUF512 domain-containing protein [Defluviitaleaceae bacterium]|nr:DUF512 domain-containing protein [Defluviitaleaceae bacterium]